MWYCKAGLGIFFRCDMLTDKARNIILVSFGKLAVVVMSSDEFGHIRLAGVFGIVR